MVAASTAQSLRRCQSPPMCNLYSLTKSQQAIRELVKAIRDLTGNLPPMPAIFSDKMAPVVRTAPNGVRELMMMRCGSRSVRSSLLAL
jgi:hypothetical protein